MSEYQYYEWQTISSLAGAVRQSPGPSGAVTQGQVGLR